VDTHVNYTAVGAFVILLFAAIIFSIIWLSSGFSFEHYSPYIVYMQESVTGLSPDALVEYNGVDVGTVEKIEINHKNPQLVELLLRVKNNTPITQGTVATLNSRGLTGLTYISLKDKGSDLRPLTILPGQAYPVIKTAPSLFTRLDTALSKLSSSLNSITESIQSVLNEENQRSIKAILKNLQQVTGMLAANNQKLTTILKNTAKASREFMPLVQSSTTTMQMLQTQMLPTTYHLLANLEDASRVFTAVSAEIKQNPAILIRGKDEQGSLGPGEIK
jgi:phospholipid/cholesterol/gamma-HCH transport system substrate-binding protein